MIYNNGGYHLVSIAIERVGGAPFEAQLKARLFDVVGMPDTASIPSDHDITPGIATMHTPGRNGWRRGLFPSDEVKGEGAIVSTIDDMQRWMAHLRTRDLFGSAATWAALTELPRYGDGSLGVYALGLMVGTYRGLNIVHHAGGVMGGTSQMLTLPDDGLDVIIMANGGRDANVGRLAEQVVDIVLADRVGPETPTVATKDFEALVSPAGGIGEIVLEPKGDKLTVHFGGESADYRKLADDAADADAFAMAATGAYRSHDAGGTATIEQQDDKLMLRVSNDHGAVRSVLVALGPTLALARPKSSLGGFQATIGLILKDGKPVGFRLDTPRTRNLEFQKV